MSRIVKTSVVIDEETWLAFKDYVLSKYGQLHGYLGRELNEAISYYLKHVAGAHTQEIEHKLSNPNKRHIQLLTWLAQNFVSEVLYSDLEAYIVENFGVDKRTKRKYINQFLIKMGFIKVDKPLHGRNVIYQINYDRIHAYLKRYLSEKELKELGIGTVKVETVEAVEADTGSKESRIEVIGQYAAERYEAGDSLQEISDKLSDFGVDMTKKVVKRVIREMRRR